MKAPSVYTVNIHDSGQRESWVTRVYKTKRAAQRYAEKQNKAREKEQYPNHYYVIEVDLYE